MKRREIEQIVAEHGPAAVVERLDEYLTDARRARIDAVLAARLASVEVAMEAPYDPNNASAVVRSVEAFGLCTIHVIAASKRVLETPGTTRGTHRWISTTAWSRLEPFVAQQRERGVVLIGARVDAELTLEQVPVDRPLCLVFGNEHEGLSAAALAACELHYRIPIHGFAESFNVSVAAALSLYAIAPRRRAWLGRAGDLDPDALARERARCYLRSVDARLARHLFGTSTSGVPGPEPDEAPCASESPPPRQGTHDETPPSE